MGMQEMALLTRLLTVQFNVERFPHSLNVAGGGSKLRVQIQTDPHYFAFVEPCSKTFYAAQDLTLRPSKRRKDLLDIERVVEAYPALRAQVPPDILDRLQPF
jgi:hypothetical protein